MMRNPKWKWWQDSEQMKCLECTFCVRIAREPMCKQLKHQNQINFRRVDSFRKSSNITFSCPFLFVHFSFFARPFAFPLWMGRQKILMRKPIEKKISTVCVCLHSVDLFSTQNKFPWDRKERTTKRKKNETGSNVYLCHRRLQPSVVEKLTEWKQNALLRYPDANWTT